MEEPYPSYIAALFWDVDPSTVDLLRHRDYVIERVMSRGGWEAMCWLRRSVAMDDLKSFIQRKGAERLAPRELAYWALICGVDVAHRAGGGKPPWSG